MNTSNFINLIGRLGDDPKTKTLTNGTILTEFSLATNDFYRDREGNRQARTQWHRVKAFGKLAELFDQHLSRGRQVSIVGSMRYSKWIDKYDQPRTSAEVIADAFSFIGASNRPADNDNDYASNMVADPRPSIARLESKKADTALSNAPASGEADADLPF